MDVIEREALTLALPIYSFDPSRFNSTANTRSTTLYTGPQVDLDGAVTAFLQMSSSTSALHPIDPSTVSEKEIESPWIVRKLVGSITGRVVIASLESLRAAGTSVVCLSPWGDSVPLLLPCIRSVPNPIPRALSERKETHPNFLTTGFEI